MFAWLLLVSVVCAEPSATEDRAFRANNDGSQQHYVVVLPKDFDREKHYSVLITLHGHGSDRWQFVKSDRDECRAARDMAAKYNLILLSPGYRESTSWMGPAAEADMLQILKQVREQYRIDKVVISGASMGGTAALTFAGLHADQVDGVVSMNGTANLVEYDQFQDAIAASFGGSKEEKPDEYRRRSAEFQADQLTMPIAMTTGGKDRVVPPQSVQRLAATLNKRERSVLWIHRPEGGHDTKYADAVKAFQFVFHKLRLD